MGNEYEEGKEFFINGQYSEALSVFEGISKDNPGNIQYLNALGRTLIFLEDYDLALNYFDQILSLDPSDIKGKIGRIIALSDLERFSEALELTNDAENIYNNGIFRARKAIILRDMNKPKSQVENCIAEALEINESDPYIWYLKAAVDTYYQNWDLAIKSLNSAMYYSQPGCSLDEGIFIGKIDILVFKYEIYSEINQLEDALACTRELSKELPNNVTALYQRSRIYYLMGDTENSLIVLNKALTLKPDDNDCLLLKGILFDEDGAPETALKIYERVLKLDPENDDAIALISLLYFYKKKYTKALEVAENALKMNPKNALALYWGYRAARKLGNLRLGRKYQKKLNDPDIDTIFLEENLQEKIVLDPWRLNNSGYHLKLIDREFSLKDRPGRIDLLYEDRDTADYVVVELKIVDATKATYNQILNYMDSIKKTIGRNKQVKGLVIATGQDNEFKSLLKNNKDLYYLDYFRLGL